MENTEIVRSILETVELEVTDFVDSEPMITCPIEYENRVLDIARKLAQSLITKSRGEIPKSRNLKKKVQTSVGKLTLTKDHVLQSRHSGFSISPRLQQLMCSLGQSLVYSESSKILHECLGIEVCAMQIQRVCKYYGSILSELVTKNELAYIPQLSDVKESDNVYVMVDGSMLFTDQKWKEIKLGRVFTDSKVIPISEKRSEIVESIYVSHMGGVGSFFPKLERHLTNYSNKVIIGDGAAWIWNWAEDNYPNSTQILDFYHAKEKLVLFSNQQFRDKEVRSKWMDTQLERLRNDLVEDVISALQKIRAKNTTAKEIKQKTIKYYLDHEDRMLYKTYRDKGLLIGSGPIEAAHRSVLQQRMKLSGQIWSIEGANAMANLRCYRKSGAWSIVNDIIKVA